MNLLQIIKRFRGKKPVVIDNEDKWGRSPALAEYMDSNGYDLSDFPKGIKVVKDLTPERFAFIMDLADKEALTKGEIFNALFRRPHGRDGELPQYMALGELGEYLRESKRDYGL